MENIYILVHRINSDNKPKYDKIYKAIEDSLNTFSSSVNIVKETSTIYYQTTFAKNIEFMKTITLYLRNIDSFTIINLTSKENLAYIWNGKYFKDLVDYRDLLAHQ